MVFGKEVSMSKIKEKATKDSVFSHGDSMEKVYKAMSSVATLNLVMGIIIIVMGIGIGVSVLTSGARLFAHRSKVLF